MTTAPSPRAFLANLPLFRELAPEQLDRMAAHTRQVRAARGEILFHRGDEVHGFHIIVYGQIKLAFISAAGDEKVVEILGPGASFGEAVMFMRRPHVVSAQALADTLLLYVERDAVFDELRRDPDFAARMIAGLSRRLHQLVGDLEAYSMRSGTERVIGFLLHRCGDGLPADGECDVTLPTTKGVIASRLNLTQEHFSRILHDLSAGGLIEVHGRTVRIVDVGRLRAYGA
jgi:CRP/FNR family transcriptional regulator, dissimilatory nitrate respiration regulator